MSDTWPVALAPARWPFGRYAYRGLLATLKPQVLALPEPDGRWLVELWYTVPDRDTGEPTRLREHVVVDRLDTPEVLDAIVFGLLESVLVHEVPEGFRVDGALYRDAHPKVDVLPTPQQRISDALAACGLPPDYMDRSPATMLRMQRPIDATATPKIIDRIAEAIARDVGVSVEAIDKPALARFITGRRP